MSDSAFGYRLTFYRDLIYKFLPREAQLKNVSASDWHVAGEFDSLRVAKIASFDELDIEGAGKLAPHASYGDLIVFPYADVDSSKLKEVSLSEPGDGHPLLVCTSVTLSPGIYEFDSHYSCVLDAIERMVVRLRGEIQKEGGSPYTIFFKSLGTPDIVLVSLPRDAYELTKVFHLIQSTRSTHLHEIAPSHHSHLPGHACSQVEAVVAFSRAANNVFDQDDFRDAEKAVGLTLRFRLRLDCGHENSVINDLKANFPGVTITMNSEQRPLVALAPHTIHGALFHFSDLMRLLNERWYVPIWREANLVDSVTYISLPNRAPDVVSGCETPDVATGFEGKAWKLNDALDEDIAQALSEIRTSLNEFGDAFLGHAQATALRAEFASFESCFYRHEFLATSRDLFPFFRQLARMLRCTDLWQRYLDTSVPLGEARNRRRDKFDNQVQALLSHLSRAVRNRMEHRSVDTNPFLPTALEHGACKLVSAYTVVIWLCCELFRLKPGHPAGELCDTEHFAACLCAGSEGRVLCQEIFRDFRCFVERQKGVRLSEAAPHGWTTRPWLLEISGRSLLRPELCMLHCMHEVAELSEWIMTDRCDGLRFSLNRWLLTEVVGNAVKLAKQDAENAGSPLGGEETQALLSYYELVISWCVVNEWKPDQANDETIMQQILSDLCYRTDPEQLIGLVRRAVFEYGLLEVSGGDITPVSTKLPDPPLRQPVRLAQLNDRRFMRALDVLENLVPELVGDTGMVCALDHLNVLMNQERDVQTRFNDVCRIFESLLIAVVESRGKQRSRARIERLIMHRWAVQATAIQGSKDFIASVLDRVDKLRDKFPGLTAREKFQEMLEWSLGFDIQFDDPNGLVMSLRKLQAYGGDSALRFPGFESFPPSVRDLVNAFFDAWNSDDNDARLRLAMELWAKSERLTFKHVLVPAT